jgi:hypothetical protein
MKQPLPTEGYKNFVEGPFVPLQTSSASTTGEANLHGKSKNTSKSGNKSTASNTLAVKTYKLPLYLVRQVESVAYWQRRKIQDVMADAMTLYLDTIPAEDRRPIPGQ